MRGLLIVSIASVLCGPPALANEAPISGWVLAQADEPLTVPDAPATTESQPDSAAEQPPAAEEDLTQPDPNDQDKQATDDGEAPPEDLSLGEIPVIETVELTPDMSKRALDSYILVKDKYQDSNLEDFENLQDFVEQSPEGKAFEADIKAAGFADVNAWNLAITTLTFAYSNAIDDQSADILQQISEIEQDTELAQDMKDRIIASLKAMIPSDNNKKVVADLLDDPVYGERLKQLELVEE